MNCYSILGARNRKVTKIQPLPPRSSQIMGTPHGNKKQMAFGL